MQILTLAMFATTLALSLLGCSVPNSAAQREAEIRACGLQDDPSMTSDVDLHACPDGSTKKTTICHFPPGNPSNAHTLCVGNSAVPAHVEHHHDTLGECPSEPPCGGDVDAGTGGGSGSGAIDAGTNVDSGIIIF